MKKSTQVVGYILNQYAQQRERDPSATSRLTQRKLSQELTISIGLVNKVVKSLATLNIVSIRPQCFQIMDVERLLTYFATARNLSKDIIGSYKLTTQSVRDIERLMPPDVVYTAYSGYRLLYDVPPIEYGMIYVYEDVPETIEDRFRDYLLPATTKRRPSRYMSPNLIVLRKNPLVNCNGGNVAPLPLIYADIWNAGDWYGHEFLKEIKWRLFESG